MMFVNTTPKKIKLISIKNRQSRFIKAKYKVVKRKTESRRHNIPQMMKVCQNDLLTKQDKTQTYDFKQTTGY